MSLYNGPARGGNRGGKDAFNWDQVKNDPHRDYYLGHSVKAAVGRWQNGKDILWYTREKGTDEEEKARQELLAVKQREEDLMAELHCGQAQQQREGFLSAEALGIKPRQIKQPSLPKLGQQEMAQLLQRNPSGEDEGVEDPEAKRLADADRMKGLGYLPHALTGSEQAEHEVMAGVNTGNPGPEASAQQEAPGSSQRLPSAQQLALIEEARAVQEKQKRKAEKREKKKAKEKKAKHEKKRHKHRDHSGERSHKRLKH